MILVDAGPIVATLVARDQHHRACTAALKELREPLGTVWPVLAEAAHLLRAWPEAQQNVLRGIDQGTYQLLALGADDVPRIRELMWKYRDRPMDLADAALVRLAERERITTVFTVDRADFEVYRLPGRRRFKIIP